MGRLQEHECYQGCHAAHWACWRDTVTAPLPVRISPAHWTCTCPVPSWCITAIAALGCRESRQENTPAMRKKKGEMGINFCTWCLENLVFVVKIY